MGHGRDLNLWKSRLRSTECMCKGSWTRVDHPRHLSRWRNDLFPNCECLRWSVYGCVWMCVRCTHLPGLHSVRSSMEHLAGPGHQWDPFKTPCILPRLAPVLRDSVQQMPPFQPLENTNVDPTIGVTIGIPSPIVCANMPRDIPRIPPVKIIRPNRLPFNHLITETIRS